MIGRRKKPKRDKPFCLCGVNDLLHKGLYDSKSIFEIDNCIIAISQGKTRSVSLHARWHPSGDPLAFGRRALEVSAMRAVDTGDALRLTEILDDWKRSGSAAGRASASLDVLLKNLSAGKLSLGAVSLLPPLRQMAVHTLGDTDIAGREKWAQEQANALLAVQETLGLMHSYMVSRRHMLAQHRENPGEPVKAAVVSTMAEAWTFLTGKLPGSGPSRNPFLRFAEAAWLDLGGRSEDSLIQALRTTLRTMKADQYFLSEHYKPNWL